MSTQVQFRRGTTAENDAFTGAIGEITVDTTLNELRVHDGSTAGGFLIASSFPSDTIMLFRQTNAPTGWTKESTHNNKALRVVTGSISNGGGTAFTTVFGSGKNTGNTANANAAHTHSISFVASVGGGTGLASGSDSQANSGSGTGSQGAGSSHLHTLSLNLHYVDVIMAKKD